MMDIAGSILFHFGVLLISECIVGTFHIWRFLY